MSVIDDILKGISPVMGAYREEAWKEVRELREDRERLEKLFKGTTFPYNGIVIIDRTSWDEDDWQLLHTREEIDAAINNAIQESNDKGNQNEADKKTV